MAESALKNGSILIIGSKLAQKIKEIQTLDICATPQKTGMGKKKAGQGGRKGGRGRGKKEIGREWKGGE